jgi:transposase
MSRQFTTADYEATLNATVTLRDCLPPDPGARFIAAVLTPRDLGALDAHAGPRGGEALAPARLLGLWFSGYATGTFSSRQMARATEESRPCHCLAGGLQPAHDTLAHCRQPFLPARQALLGRILLSAQEVGGLTLGHLSLDGTNIHADASKSRAISDQRRLAGDSPLRPEVDQGCALTEHAAQTEGPAGLVLAHAIALRHERLANLAQAHAV